MSEEDQNKAIESILLYIKNYFEEYKFDPVKDHKYYNILLAEFPNLDLLEEVKLFHIWVIDSGAKSENPRLSLRKWLKNSSQWSRSNR